MEVASLRAQINSQASFTQYQSHIQAPLPISIPPPPNYNNPPPKQSVQTISIHQPSPPINQSTAMPTSLNNSYSQAYMSQSNLSSNITPNKSSYSQSNPPYATATSTNKYSPTSNSQNSSIKSLSNLGSEVNYNQVTSSSSSLASLLSSKKINNTSAPLPSSTSLPLMQQQSNQLQILNSNLTNILKEKDKLIEEQDRITMSGSSGRTLNQKQKVISITQRLSEIDKEASTLRSQIKSLNY